jgi:hypothetical protein
VVTTGDGEMFVGMNVDEIGVVTITLDSKWSETSAAKLLVALTIKAPELVSSTKPDSGTDEKAVVTS